MRVSSLMTLSVLVPLCWSQPVLAKDDHYKLMEIYTHMASAAFFAQKNCPGIKADKTKLLVLRTMAKISDDEEAMIDESIRSIASEIRKQFESSGRLAWCADTYESLGPNGKLLPGLISR